MTDEKQETCVGCWAEHYQDPDDRVMIQGIEVMSCEEDEEDTLVCIVEYQVVRGDKTETLQAEASEFFALYNVIREDDGIGDGLDDFVDQALADLGEEPLTEEEKRQDKPTETTVH